MSITNWGELTKALDDPETIEEAIERLISEHNDNPDAHLGENGALLSHKASEIIDHLAYSIVSDKIAEWIEVKMKGSFARSDFHWATIFESIDGYDVSDPDYVEVGYTGVRIKTSISANNYQSIQRQIFLNPAISWINSMKMRAGLQFVDNDNQNFWIGVGDCVSLLPNPTIRHIGFKVINDTIYGTVANGTTESTLNCGTITELAKTVFSFEYDGSAVEFFIDGVSKGSITTNIPSGSSNADVSLSSSLKVTSAGSYKVVFLSTYDYWVDV